jgi:hypothetical protein
MRRYQFVNKLLCFEEEKEWFQILIPMEFLAMYLILIRVQVTSKHETRIKEQDMRNKNANEDGMQNSDKTVRITSNTLTIACIHWIWYNHTTKTYKDTQNHQPHHILHIFLSLQIFLWFSNEINIFHIIFIFFLSHTTPLHYLLFIYLFVYLFIIYLLTNFSQKPFETITKAIRKAITKAITKAISKAITKAITKAIIFGLANISGWLVSVWMNHVLLL